MPYDLKAGKSIGRGGKSPLAFFILVILYTLSFIMLPFAYDRQTAHITPQTVIAKDSDSDGDHGGGGDENSGGNDGGDSGESSGDDGGGADGGSDDGNGGEAVEDHQEDSDHDADDGNESDLDKEDGDRDRQSENENHKGNRQDDGRFDFGDLDDLKPMTPQEEADVVGNWDQ